MYRIVIIDDQDEVLRALKRELTAPDRNIEIYVDPIMALNSVRSRKVDLVMSDYRMPSMDGVAVLTRMRQIDPEVPRLLISGDPDLKFLKGAINEASIYSFVYAIVKKPWDTFELRNAVNNALVYRDLLLERTKLAAENSAHKKQLLRLQRERARLELQHPEIAKILREHRRNSSSLAIEKGSLSAVQH